MIPESNYLKYRGKCKEYCEALCKEDSSLTIVRGYYYDFQWGEQPHWWCTRPDGVIIDPTKLQFPSAGMGDYVPFDGSVTCSECGKEGKEEDFRFESNYCFCSVECNMRFVGL